MSIELRIGTDADQKIWDNAILSSQHGTIFHTWKFLKIVEKHSKMKLIPIMGVEKDEVFSIFPIFFHKKKFLKLIFSPPPQMAIPYLGPVIQKYTSLPQYELEPQYMEFQKQVDLYIENEIDPDYISITTPPGLTDLRPFIWNGYTSTPFYNYVIDLHHDEEYLWNQIKNKARQDITRTQRRGVYVEFGGLDEINLIFEDTQRRYGEQGLVQNVPKEYITDIYNSFPDNIKLFIARQEKNYISGHIDLLFNKKVSSWIGSAKPNIPGIAPNDLLHWEAEKYALKNGYASYEIIGANTPRLSSNKIKYGPRPELYFILKKYTLLGGFVESIYTKFKTTVKSKHFQNLTSIGEKSKNNET